MERAKGSCASWIRRPENKVLAVVGQPRSKTSPALLGVYALDTKTAMLSPDPVLTCEMEEEDGNPVGFAVHPSGEEFVCATTKGCKLFELNDQDFIYKLVPKVVPPVQSIGLQKCLAFSTDGSKFATGGESSISSLVPKLPVKAPTTA